MGHPRVAFLLERVDDGEHLGCAARLALFGSTDTGVVNNLSDASHQIDRSRVESVIEARVGRRM